MAYKSKFRPFKPKKYIGNVGNIICRSTWERALAKWCDTNSHVLKWNMEGVVIPYFDKGNGKTRRYFMDFYMEFDNGETWIVEVKPKYQTVPPVKKKRKTRRYMNEVKTYATNTSKWETAKIYAEQRGWTFRVWHEDNLRKLGLKII